MSAPTRISQRPHILLKQVDGGQGLVRKLRAGEAKQWPQLATTCRTWWGEPEYIIVFETPDGHGRVMATRGTIKGFLKAGARIIGRIA